MKFKTFRYTLILALTICILAGFAWADDQRIRVKFGGNFTGAEPPAPIALFDGVLKIDGERLQFDGESYAGAFPDGTPCLSPIGVCSVWVTDEGEFFNQTDFFAPMPDGSFTQGLTFVGGTGEFEGASGMGSVKGTLDDVGGFRGKLRGVLFEGDDDDDDDDDD